MSMLRKLRRLRRRRMRKGDAWRIELVWFDEPVPHIRLRFRFEGADEVLELSCDGPETLRGFAADCIRAAEHWEERQ